MEGGNVSPNETENEDLNGTDSVKISNFSASHSNINAKFLF